MLQKKTILRIICVIAFAVFWVLSLVISMKHVIRKSSLPCDVFLEKTVAVSVEQALILPHCFTNKNLILKGVLDREGEFYYLYGNTEAYLYQDHSKRIYIELNEIDYLKIIRQQEANEATYVLLEGMIARSGGLYKITSIEKLGRLSDMR